MYGCTIRIVTKTEDGDSVFEARGVFLRQIDGFRVRYHDGGDEVDLCLAGGVLTMDRRGEVGLSAVFEEGRDTQMITRLGDCEGRIPLKTSRLQFLDLHGDFSVRLTYELRFEQDFSRFQLDIFIADLEEIS